jgi:hypothetical protein
MNAEEDPGVDCGFGDARLCQSRRQGDDAKKYQEKAVKAAIAEAKA